MFIEALLAIVAFFIIIALIGSVVSGILMMVAGFFKKDSGCGTTIFFIGLLILIFSLLMLASH